MIDLHCHILPGIDDGAENIDASIAMAEKAIQQGITHIYAHPIIIMENTAMKITSHFSSRFVTSRIREKTIAFDVIGRTRSTYYRNTDRRHRPR